jgi:thymidylate synthase (FAD)
MRYTSQGLLDAHSQIGILDLGHQPDIEALERVFYLRQPGQYRDRFGANYAYTEAQREEDLELCWANLQRYAKRIEQGFSEEHARGLLPFDYRQHFVASFNNIRSLWHMLDLRMGKGAQGEAQQAMGLLWQATKGIAPQLQDWYQDTRAGRARLAP